MIRVVFIPFDTNSQREFVDRTVNWQRARASKDYKIICYQTGVKIPLLQNIIGGSQIYIRGHGLLGVPAIYTEERIGEADAQPAQQLQITVVIDRLIEMGLPTNFRGTIKFYSCFSGLAKPKSAVPMTGDTKKRWLTGKPYLANAQWRPAAEALAKIGANYFRSQGYTQCRFIGYKGPLKGEYDIDPDVDGDSTDHKYCSVVTFDYRGVANFSFSDRSTRAKDAQKEF